MTKLKNILVALSALVVFGNIANAQAVKASYSLPATAEEPLQVKYLGADGDYLLFKVTLQASNPKRALFAIEDKNEGQLYSSGMGTNIKTATIKIEKRENDSQVLNFRLSVGKNTFTKSFSVNTNTVETTTVAEKSDITKL